eukprot:39764-Amorphochlora_amoeboformis.AAC.1
MGASIAAFDDDKSYTEGIFNLGRNAEELKEEFYKRDVTAYYSREDRPQDPTRRLCGGKSLSLKKTDRKNGSSRYKIPNSRENRYF